MRIYRKHRTKIIISTSVLVAIAVLLVAYILGPGRGPQKLNDQSAKTTSTSKTAQSNYSSGSSHPQSSSNNNPTTAVDKNGQNTTTTIDTPTDQWSTSRSGIITVKQPVANSTLSTGDTLRGSAQVPSVNYTLADNVLGVISQGSLSVVNGNFSGILNFSHKGPYGQLSVFNFDSSTGAEINVVNIPVNF